MREEPKHLKRGLKDISPLFQSMTVKKDHESMAVSTAVPPHVQSLSLFCPEAPQNSHFLNSCLAAKMQSLAYQCALISVGQQKVQKAHAPVKRFSISLRQFEEICQSKSRSAESFESSVFFFDFDYSNPITFEKVMPFLDRWILLLKPEQESITEGYKFLKASLPLNPNLECFVIVNGLPGNISSHLFERFSELTSRHLGVAPHWLGYFDPRFPSAMDGLALESLQMASGDSLEKRALSGFVYPSVKGA